PRCAARGSVRSALGALSSPARASAYPRLAFVTVARSRSPAMPPCTTTTYPSSRATPLPPWASDSTQSSSSSPRAGRARASLVPDTNLCWQPMDADAYRAEAEECLIELEREFLLHLSGRK